VQSVVLTDLLERPVDARSLSDGAVPDGDGVDLRLRPFQVLTLRATRPPAV
jgi:hypothetical protein